MGETRSPHVRIAPPRCKGHAACLRLCPLRCVPCGSLPLRPLVIRWALDRSHVRGSRAGSLQKSCRLLIGECGICMWPITCSLQDCHAKWYANMPDVGECGWHTCILQEPCPRQFAPAAPTQPEITHNVSECGWHTCILQVSCPRKVRQKPTWPYPCKNHAK